MDRIIDKDGVEWIREWDWIGGEIWVSVYWHGGMDSKYGGYSKGELMPPYDSRGPQ